MYSYNWEGLTEGQAWQGDKHEVLEQIPLELRQRLRYYVRCVTPDGKELKFFAVDYGATPIVGNLVQFMQVLALQQDERFTTGTMIYQSSMAIPSTSVAFMRPVCVGDRLC